MANQQWSKPPAMEIDPSKQYTATIKTTKGEIVVKLEAAYAPITVNNFVFLSRQGFYDNVIFHRVIAGFVIQGGDPTGSGRGGPGYTFQDEVDPKKNPLKHQTGTLSMANAGPGTNGSQFFITHAPQPHLDGRHTVFGNVTSGMDIVLAIRQGDAMLGVTITEE
ncbi:MAG TPA: peptidylprolyl isomerase [Roseiflexaceae bacterium]|nr:peptidylprolyl isomerase [Roseiflexaceae bacterium]HMP40223.1 peptidylprolyl isomerase [Roseiflexaceae bacterium]